MHSTDNRRGIVAMLLAMALFIANDTLLKLASAVYPPGQIMAVRGIFATALAAAIAAGLGHLGAWRRLASPMVLARASLESGVALLFITSLAHLPIANITAITQSTPTIMTLMTVMLGIERVGWRRWSAILVGFLGVLLIVKPSPAGFDVYALVALAAAALVAARDLATRFIGKEVPTTLVTVTTTGCVGLAGALAGTAEVWQPIDLYALLLPCAAVLVTLGNLAIVAAFRGTDVSIISPFRYSVVVLAIASGVLVFGELPDLIAAAGIVLIVGSGIYTIHREQVRLREVVRAEPPVELREAA